MKKLFSLIHSTMIVTLLGQTVLSSGYAADTLIAEAVPNTQKKASVARPKPAVRKIVVPVSKRTQTPGFFAQKIATLKEFVQPIKELGVEVKKEIKLTWEDTKLEYFKSGQWKEVLFDSGFLLINNVADGYKKRQNGIFKEATDDRKIAEKAAKDAIIQTEREVGPTAWEAVEKIASGKSQFSPDRAKGFLLEVDQRSERSLEAMQHKINSRHNLNNINGRIGSYDNLEESKRDDTRNIEIINENQNAKTSYVCTKEFQNYQVDSTVLSNKDYAQRILERRKEIAESIGLQEAAFIKSSLPSGQFIGNLQFPIHIKENESYLSFRNPFKNATGDWGLRLPFTTDNSRFFTMQGLGVQSIFSPIKGTKKYPDNPYVQAYYPDYAGEEKSGSHTFAYALARHSNLLTLLAQQTIADLGVKQRYFNYHKTEAYRTFLNNRRQLDRVDGGEIRKVIRDFAGHFTEIAFGGLQNVSGSYGVYSKLTANFLDDDSTLRKGLTPRFSKGIVNFICDRGNSLFGSTSSKHEYTWTRILLSAVISTAIEKAAPLAIRFVADVVTNMIVRPVATQMAAAEPVVPKGPPSAVKQQILLMALSGQDQQAEYLMNIHGVEPDQLQIWIHEALINGIKTVQ